MATLISFPFDVVRTRIVAQPTTNLKDPSSLYYTNTRNALIQIVNREGFFGLYKGILPRLLSIGPTSAINFAGYNTFTEIYYYLKQDQLNIAEKFLCGSLSGMFYTNMSKVKSTTTYMYLNFRTYLLMYFCT